MDSSSSSEVAGVKAQARGKQYIRSFLGAQEVLPEGLTLESFQRKNPVPQLQRSPLCGLPSLNEPCRALEASMYHNMSVTWMGLTESPVLASIKEETGFSSEQNTEHRGAQYICQLSFSQYFRFGFLYLKEEGGTRI